MRQRPWPAKGLRSHKRAAGCRSGPRKELKELLLSKMVLMKILMRKMILMRKKMRVQLLAFLPKQLLVQLSSRVV